MTEEDCENCRFYIEINDSIGGCKRYPPVYKPENAVRTLAFRGKPIEAFDKREWSFPVVDRSEWCGEYQQFKKDSQ